ncbi:MAG: hypothetical protein EA416_06080 [Trueperaceae bacterium]|nr:MAG: hypothetical protein EA416_06080 [Trueperaceae bacterium]
MSDALWTRLTAPFPALAVTWDVVSVDAAVDEAVVAPRLRREAIVERLDQHCGVAGWSVTFTPFANGAVGCTVEIAGVRKSAVADALMAGPAATADAALAVSAASFGLVVPPAAVPQRVAFDAEAGIALHDPELVGDHVAEAGAGATAGAATDAGPADAPMDPASAGASDDDSALDVHAADVEARGLSREGLVMIDRLVERLKESGHGLQAARLLVRYGGYGKDAEAARALYGALRALLKRGDDVEVEA